MARSLPPLAALRAFEAAARHLSFTWAAAELGMTQAAVSYQIKVLEERVGSPLFRREKRGVALTAAGAQLSAEASAAFDRLAAAYAAVQGSTSGVLLISAIPTFATNWLARHLGSFQVAHPEIAVQLNTTRQIADFTREPLDVALRAGEGHWPGLTAHPLVPLDFTPMLSPALLERVGFALHTPEDLLRFPLVNPTDPWWNLWFRHAGVRREGFDEDNGSKMGSQDLEAIAAVAGHGVALLTPFFYAEQKRAGQLVQPFDILCPIARAYYLVYPTARRNVPKIRAFREWLLPHFAEPSPEHA